jgi:photosystem II stability/assembly factor-like uncharacterized protein
MRPVKRRGIVGIQVKLHNWAVATLTALAVLAMNIWEGCEKSPVSDEGNPVPVPVPVPITSDVKWQVVFSDPRANFSFRPTVAFDSSGTFGFAIGEQQSYFRTTEGGRSWLAIPPDGGGWNLFITSKTVAYRFYPFQRTDDAGKSWQMISTPTNFGNLIPNAENRFFFLVFDTLGTWHKTECWKTENGGISWTKMGTPVGAIFDVTTADGIDLAIPVQESPTSPLSLYYSRDAGTSWTKSYIDTSASGTGWSYNLVRLLTAEDGVGVAWRSNATPETEIGMFRTSDGGASWKEVYQDHLPYAAGGPADYFVLARSPRLLVLISTDPARFASYTYNSDDAGLTWIPTGNWPGPYSYYTPTFAPPDWEIGISGPWMTQDAGKS